MGLEIERKFLPSGPSWPRVDGTVYEQGYLCNANQGVVRVRIAGTQGFLTIKDRGDGLVRSEYEYPIPVTDAREMLVSFCGETRIVKTRYRCVYEGFVWEIDEFAGSNQGLVLIEVELSDPGDKPPLPDWVGEEVTGDPRYFNSFLVEHPWKEWGRIRS